MLWQKTIKSLRERTEQLGKQVQIQAGFWNEEKKENERLRGVLKDLNEAIARSVNMNRDSEARIETLDWALAESKTMNAALEDENKDLLRQNELLYSVLRQLSVAVKLPARKRG